MPADRNQCHPSDQQAHYQRAKGDGVHIERAGPRRARGERVMPKHARHGYLSTSGNKDRRSASQFLVDDDLIGAFATSPTTTRCVIICQHQGALLADWPVVSSIPSLPIFVSVCLLLLVIILFSKGRLIFVVRCPIVIGRFVEIAGAESCIISFVVVVFLVIVFVAVWGIRVKGGFLVPRSFLFHLIGDSTRSVLLEGELRACPFGELA